LNRFFLSVKLTCLILFIVAANVQAQQGPGDISTYLPAAGEVIGWSPDGSPEKFLGDDLFMMINGGADIYHEYGFKQVIGADYVNSGGKAIRLEIYEMENSAAAYGIYTFKTGDGGKNVDIGQDALLEEYYLNFWKGNVLVTVIGPDPEEETVQGVVAIAKAVDARITETGERPSLARLLLSAPQAFSHPKYVRGFLGVMNSYVFDTKNVFGVREGMIGTIGNCRALVFQYADEKESSQAYEQASASFDGNPRFKDRTKLENHYSMIGREGELVVINQTGRYIAIVIGSDPEKAKDILDGLGQKLDNR